MGGVIIALIMIAMWELFGLYACPKTPEAAYQFYGGFDQWTVSEFTGWWEAALFDIPTAENFSVNIPSGTRLYFGARTVMGSPPNIVYLVDGPARILVTQKEEAEGQFYRAECYR